MKRFMTIFALAMLVMAPAAANAQQYGWTISSSTADPYVNTGGTVGTLAFIYLWLACTTTDGVSAAEMDLAYSPAGLGVNIAVTAQNGFLNAGAGNALLLATACQNGPIVAAQIIYQALAPGELCLVPSAANNLNVSVDCTNFLTWNNETIGFSFGGAALTCDDGAPLCQTISVEEQSWGQIKGLYR